jgi:uncharacterized repeat protein (TIGR04138 family)|tara:strand:- start:422 stop:814 length:393 start_codon:yes stop_codon:yes gene_type:complete
MARDNKKHHIGRVFTLLKMLNKDKRYEIEAYSFAIQALEFTTKKLNRKGHVSGEEILDGIRVYALEEFGPMARTVLENWGITKTKDFGEIIFNMINAGLLGKTEQDSIEDFNNRFDFKTAFDNVCTYTLH